MTENLSPKEKLCAKGLHPLTDDTVYYYRRNRLNKDGKVTFNFECKLCKKAQVKRYQKTHRVPKFTEAQAAEVGRLLLLRHNHQWLGERMWGLFRQLLKENRS